MSHLGESDPSKGVNMCKGPEWKRARVVQRSEATVAGVQGAKRREVGEAEAVRGQIMWGFVGHMWCLHLILTLKGLKKG